MHDAIYESAKTILSENERLFEKLANVAEEYNAIEFDESGFYDEAVARCERHYATLTRKIAEALRDGIAGTDVALKKAVAPNQNFLELEIRFEDAENAPQQLGLRIGYGISGTLELTRY